MNRCAAFLPLLACVLFATLAFGQAPSHGEMKVFLNEIQPGALAAPQFCTVIYADRSFHSEKADIKQGNAVNRKVYEGQVSESDWNALIAIVDGKNFQDMKVPQSVPPLVMQDSHPYTISVARPKGFQNMEFMDNKSLKPYEPQIKPLLQWWKSFRGKNTTESSAGPDPQCALDRSHSVFAQ
jgi:hypothetical protein